MAINGIVQYNDVSPRYYAVDPMILPSGNPFKCHEEVLALQPMFPRICFDSSPPDRADAFRFLKPDIRTPLGWFFKVVYVRMLCRSFLEINH